MPPVHDSDQDLAILRLAWRADAIDGWRKSVDDMLAVHGKQLQELVTADKIAEAVAAKLNEQQTNRLTLGNLRFSKLQTWSAIGAVVLTGAGLLMSALAQAGVI